MDKRIDQYILKNAQNSETLNILRTIFTSTELEETLKWGAPTYMIDGKNVIGMASFKSYVGIWFFNGVFLRDRANVLMSGSEGITKSQRQWRFNPNDEIDVELVLEYVNEAIANQKAGKEMKPKKKELNMPYELAEVLNADKNLKASFLSLTPGKQREYADYINEAKQEKTKLSRLNKILPMIIAGAGLHDKYKDC